MGGGRPSGSRDGGGEEDLGVYRDAVGGASAVTRAEALPAAGEEESQFS